MKKQMVLIAMVLLSGSALYGKIYSIPVDVTSGTSMLSSGEKLGPLKITTQNDSIAKIVGPDGAVYTKMNKYGIFSGTYGKQSMTSFFDVEKKSFVFNVGQIKFTPKKNPSKALMNILNKLPNNKNN